MTSKLLTLSAICLLTVFSCKDNGSQEEKNTTTSATLPVSEVKQKLTLFKDSADLAWKEMIASDDQKIAYSKRLLDEVSYMPRFDAATHEKLVGQWKTLKSKRYERSAVTSTAIDAYDAATDSLLKPLRQFVLSTPGYENYPLCSELLSDIAVLDNNLVMQRIRYDKWAFQFNRLLNEQKETVSQSDSLKQLAPMGTFQLEN